MGFQKMINSHDVQLVNSEVGYIRGYIQKRLLVRDFLSGCR